jgi:hypothetical protein
MKGVVTMFEKGQRFETSHDNKTYEFVGKWSGSMVLAPENDENAEVLIYTEGEINELLDDGKLKLLDGPEMVMG